MRIFTLSEKVGISLVFLFLIVMTLMSFSVSKRNERDDRRNLDVSFVAGGLNKYANDYGAYPLSSADGKIIACVEDEPKVLKDELGKYIYKENAKKPVIENYVPCEWGKDSLLDVLDVNYPKYVSILPNDPHSDKGVNYFYVSDGEKFVLMGSFEGKSLNEYSKDLKTYNVNCGKKICNFFKASSSNAMEMLLGKRNVLN